MMEGISHEAASLRRALQARQADRLLRRQQHHDRRATDLTFTDDTAKRFEAYGWQVLHIDDVNDLDAIEGAIAEAKADTTRPTMVVTRTHIGYGSPNKQDSAKAHGEPLGEDEIVADEEEPTAGRAPEPFFVPDEALAHWRKSEGARRASSTPSGTAGGAPTRVHIPPMPRSCERRLAGELPEGWESEDPDVHEGERQRRQPRRVRRGVERDGRFDSRAGRRLGRPHAVEQHVGQSVEELRAGRLRRPIHPFRHSRARNGRAS